MSVLGIARVKSMLPHRYPLLLLDAVLELVPGEHVRALKAVSGAEPWYRDIPDDAPPATYAYPAVLLVESWCQCGALLATGTRDAGTVALLGGLSGARFGRDVYPGEVLEHRIRLVRRLADVWILSGESVVGEVAVLRVDEAVMALRPAGVLGRGPGGEIPGAVPAGAVPAGAAVPADGAVPAHTNQLRLTHE